MKDLGYVMIALYRRTRRWFALLAKEGRAPCGSGIVLTFDVGDLGAGDLDALEERLFSIMDRAADDRAA